MGTAENTGVIIIEQIKDEIERASGRINKMVSITIGKISKIIGMYVGRKHAADRKTKK